MRDTLQSQIRKSNSTALDDAINESSGIAINVHSDTNIKKTITMKKNKNKPSMFSEVHSLLKFNKKNNFIIAGIIFLLFFVSPFLVTAQDCDVKVISNNNIESVNKDGRTYFVTLLNSGSSRQVIHLSATNHNTGENPDGSDSKNNVNLTSVLLTNDGNEISGDIILDPNSSFNFQLKVTVPDGTGYGYWNDIVITASSDVCKDSPASLVLYTFIPDPNEQ